MANSDELGGEEDRSLTITSVDDCIERCLDSQVGADVDEAQEEDADSILSQGSTADELRQELEQEVSEGCGCKDQRLRSLDTKKIYKKNFESARTQQE